jgi:hypothetical protein
MREADGLKHVSHYVEKAMSGIIDMTTLDTTPGAGGAMAPPPGADLTSTGYRYLMRDRYKHDPLYRQHMRIFARRLAETEITGPHAADARWILEQIG